ncbi:MAG: FecR domain-containing protein [Elusimicrobiota bacterium]
MRSTAVLAATLLGAFIAVQPLLCEAAEAKRPVAGIVLVVKGKVQDPAASKPKRLAKGVMIREGDTLKTGKGDLLSLALVGGPDLRINEDSTVDMESGGGRANAGLRIRTGQVWIRTLHGMSAIQVRSDLASCSVRLSQAELDVEMGERMTIKVYKGEAEVFNDTGRRRLGAGETVQVSSVGAPPSEPRALTAQERGTWQESLGK